MSVTPITSPIESLAWIIGHLKAAVGEKHILLGPVCTLIWNRLNRIGNRFALLAAKAKAGCLRAPICRRSPAAEAAAEAGPGAEAVQSAAEPVSEAAPAAIAALAADAAPPAKAAEKPLRLPHGVGWLVRLCGWKAAGGTTLIEALLQNPEMQALLRDAPQLAEVLRPLCYMLGVKVDPALFPPRRRRPRVRKPTPVRATEAVAASAGSRPDPEPLSPRRKRGSRGPRRFVYIPGVVPFKII